MDYSTDYEGGIRPGTRVRHARSRGVIWVVLGREVEDVEPESFEDACPDCEGKGYYGPDDVGPVDDVCQSCYGRGEVTFTSEEWDTRVGDGYVVVMVGDDRREWADADDLTPLDDDEHVCSCGQDGCTAEA